MQKIKIDAFQIMGISVRTTNENGQAAQDIGQLLGRFLSEGIAAQIPHKIGEDIYSIYTNYELDYTKPYDVVLGCKVSSLENIPEGLVGHTFEGGTYQPFVAKGDLMKGAVYNKWTEIWKEESTLNRAYTADFEVYGVKAQDASNAEVDIFIAVEDK